MKAFLFVIAWTGGELIGYIAMLIGATSITGAILSPNILPAAKINTTSTISVSTRMR